MIRRILLLLIVALANLSGGRGRLSAAETWAERLGYQPDQVVVLLELLGSGATLEAEAAAAELVDGGLTASVSASAVGPWFPHFCTWRRNQPDACTGLALTLNSESDGYRLRPLTGPNSSIVDPQGYLWRTIVQTTINASPDDVERELLAQLRLARDSGLQPSHFTTHLGTLFARADLAEVYLRTSQQHWIPAPVVELTPNIVEDLAAAGFPLEAELIELVARYPLPKLDDFAVIPGADSYEAKREGMIALINALPPGLTMLSARPALEGPSLAASDEQWMQRVWDYQVLRDDAVHAAFAERGAVLTTWTEVMQRFEGGRPSLGEIADRPAENDAAPVEDAEAGE